MRNEDLDHERIDWNRVASATYAIEQRFHYFYPGPIRDLRHRLMIAPPERHGDQERLEHTLSISPHLETRVLPDPFGNYVMGLEVDAIEGNIVMAYRSLVRRSAGTGDHLADIAMLADPRLRAPRRLTRADDALTAAANSLRSKHTNRFELAYAIADFVNREMTYTKKVTDVFTTASVAFAMRRGVCQDYAHVTLAIAQKCGLLARYVSGHLLGEGATHAWVEFLLPSPRGSAVVLSLDPTHGRTTTMSYLVVAVGRDYDDIAPTSGVFKAPYAGTLKASQRVRLTQIEPAA